MLNLNYDVKTSRPINATAAGTSNINGTVLDMQGFTSVRFTALLGALTAGQVTGLKLQHGTLANGADMADLAGASVGPAADGDSNKLLILELKKQPINRYVRPVLTRATQNAAVDGVISYQYNGENFPTAVDATVSAQASV